MELNAQSVFVICPRIPTPLYFERGTAFLSQTGSRHGITRNPAYPPGRDSP